MAARKAFNIQGIGEKAVSQLSEAGLIHDPADVFPLREEELVELPGWGTKRAHKLITEIDKRKDISLTGFLFALSIRGVGHHAAHILATHFHTLDNVRQASAPEMAAVAGIGETVAHSAAGFFQNSHNRALIAKMLDAGVTIQPEGDTTS